MNERTRIVLIAATSAAVTSVLLTILFNVSRREPEWKASGDGKTIFNSRTGELRYTANGRSVIEVQAERAVENRNFSEKREQEAMEAERARQSKQESVRAQNSASYERIKRFVDTHPRITTPNVDPNTEFANYVWEKVTQPFRQKRMISALERDSMLEFLSTVTANEPYKSDPQFSGVIDELNRLDYGSY